MPYLLNMDRWPFQMIHPLSEELPDNSRLGFLEMAHTHWGDRRYLEVIDAYGGRPVSGNHATLLYATA